MGAIAKGKINASEAKIGDRVIVRVWDNSTEAGRETLARVNEVNGTAKTKGVSVSHTKTGEGVTVTTITDKYKVNGRRGYVLVTGEGEFYAEPIQTMWSAPEDAAGIKRAHAEALIEDQAYEIHAEALAEDAERTAEQERTERAAEVETVNLEQAEAARTENEAPGGIYHGTEWAAKTSQPEDLTLNSHAGKVDSMNNDANTAQTAQRETTGSAVVRLLERVQDRIRQNHPEVPEVVIVTGAGIGPMGGKWGHFRPQGWTAKGEDETTTHIHEMFMAGETLAKGARQVLQTMLHENGHGLAEVRRIQDTSRQHRWHNKEFLKIAQELGLEYRKGKANPQLGYSEVTLTDATVAEYADLLDALDREIHLMVRLPGWLGGTGKDGDEEGDGGETMPKAPKPPTAPSTNNLKAVCRCEEPNIIRLSRKVLDKGVVRCNECEEPFTAA